MEDKMKKYGLMTYIGKPMYNVGDYIQSLAAKQYLPKVDALINREQLSEYKGEEVRMIMNGWYTHYPEYFKPSNKINPFYTSFHLNSNAKDAILNKEENVLYLKSKTPIGCRDYYTLEALKNKGVDAYFSSCLTTTLDLTYHSEEKTGAIYFVDVLWTLPTWGQLIRLKNKIRIVKHLLKLNFSEFSKRKNILNQFFSKELLNQAIDIKHMLPPKHSEERRFAEAEDRLKKYATAKLVVTSRIHVALPCLALGTPVVFINYGLEKPTDQSRFKGILEMMNTINIDAKGNITASFDFPTNEKIGLENILKNPTKHKEYAQKLKEKCFEFINK